MKRLCFLLPDVGSAHGVVGDLRAVGIDDGRIYVIANGKTPLGDLPEAGLDDTSDFYPQLERGLALGGAIGVIGGLVAMRVAGAVFGGAAVILFGLIGAGINGIMAGIAGAAFPNSRLTEFESAIEAGHVLVILDLSAEEVPAVTEVVKNRHPEVELIKLERHTPIIPRRP